MCVYVYVDVCVRVCDVRVCDGVVCVPPALSPLGDGDGVCGVCDDAGEAPMASRYPIPVRYHTFLLLLRMSTVSMCAKIKSRRSKLTYYCGHRHMNYIHVHNYTYT